MEHSSNRSFVRRDLLPVRPAAVPAAGRAWLLVIALLMVHSFPAITQAEPGDAQAGLPRAPRGTRFAFEVIESHDAKYQGDTPGHTGRDGGLEVRPNVAIGDAVYRDDAEGDQRVVGRITGVVWERVSGSLTIEFDPEPLVRIAVGDEVWIDLNPAPGPVGQPAPQTPAASGDSAR